MTNEITEDIRALLECVKRADWNCVAHDKPELYNIWNKLTYPDDSKGQELIQQILQALELKKRIEERINEIDINLTGSDARIHPEIYKSATLIMNELQQLLGDKKINVVDVSDYVTKGLKEPQERRNDRTR